MTSTVNVTNIDVVWPSVANYDIAFLPVIIKGTSTRTINTPSGWSLIDGYSNASSENVTSALYWKRCNGTESGNQNVTADAIVGAGVSFTGQIYTVRGGLSSGTPFEAAVLDHGTSPFTGTDITTLGPDRLVCNFWHWDDDLPFTAGAGWTEQSETLSNAGADKGFAMTTKAQATAGSVTRETATITGVTWAACYTLAVITN